MADTTKLASTFKATRLGMKVGVGNLFSALERCEMLGLQPKLGSHSTSRKEIVFYVVLPYSDYGHVHGFVVKEMGTLGCLRVQESDVELVCPPPPEKPADPDFGLIKRLT